MALAILLFVKQAALLTIPLMELIAIDRLTMLDREDEQEKSTQFQEFDPLTASQARSQLR